jgi:hypothetical protein
MVLAQRREAFESCGRQTAWRRWILYAHGQFHDYLDLDFDLAFLLQHDDKLRKRERCER